MTDKELDDLILANVTPRWRKVAMVIARSCDAESKTLENDCERAAHCIEALVGVGRLVAQGNIKNWRHSEIRLP